MSNNSNMYFKLKKWDTLACCLNANNLIFEKPIYPKLVVMEGPWDTRSFESLAQLLEQCDLTGTRKKTNQREYFETTKNEITGPYNLKFWEFVGGKTIVKQIVDNYMKNHNLNIEHDKYPIWRKPIIKKVPTKTFSWKSNDYNNCLECNNIDDLCELAKDCDILICGGKSVHSQYVIMKEWNPQTVYNVSHYNELFHKQKIILPKFKNNQKLKNLVGLEVKPCHVHSSVYNRMYCDNLHVRNKYHTPINNKIMYGF